MKAVYSRDNKIFQSDMGELGKDSQDFWRQHRKRALPHEPTEFWNGFQCIGQVTCVRSISTISPLVRILGLIRETHGWQIASLLRHQRTRARRPS